MIRDNVITENWKSIEDPNNADYSILGSGVDLFNETEEKTGPSYVSVLDNVIKSNNNFGVSTNLDYTNIQSNNIQNHDVGINIGLLSCGNSVLNNTILQSGLAGITDENIPSTSYVANNVVFGTSQGYNVIYPGGVSLNVSSGSIVNPVVFPPVSETSGSNTEVEGVECNNYVEACLLADSFRNVKVRHLDLKSLQDYKRSMKQFHRV